MTDTAARLADDEAWRQDGEENGWKLGPPAHWLLRLPGVRLIRYLRLAHRVHVTAAAFASVGVGLGRPNQRDLWVLHAIRRGWC